MITAKDIIKVSLKDIPAEVDFATETAYKKCQKENTANTWQKSRSNQRKFSDLFPGDLAKNIIRIEAEKLGIKFEDYDKTRTDEFQFPDKFDLKYNNNIIEVKSSLEKYTDHISSLISNRRFIIYCKKEIAHIIFQVLYVFESTEGKQFFIDVEQMNDEALSVKYAIKGAQGFVRTFIKHSPYAYIMGFVTKEMVQGKKETAFNYINKNAPGDNSRQYVDFFITEGIPFIELTSYLK